MQAAGFDFHAQTVYKIESGRRAVSVDEAYALAEILGFSVEWTMRGVPEIDSRLKVAALEYSQLLRELGAAMDTGHVLRRELKRVIDDEQRAGRAVPKGYLQLADFAGLDLFLESYGLLLKQKAAVSVLKAKKPSMTPRALEEQAFDYQTELEDDGH